MAARELRLGSSRADHSVEVLTTSLESLDRPGRRTRVEDGDGVRVHYLATPARYRWMGITPTLPVELSRRAARRRRTSSASGTRSRQAWPRGAAARRAVRLRALGMFRARLRKVALKRALDSTLAAGSRRARGCGRPSPQRAGRRRGSGRRSATRPRSARTRSPNTPTAGESSSQGSSPPARPSSSTWAGSPPGRGSSTSSRRCGAAGGTPRAGRARTTVTDDRR